MLHTHSTTGPGGKFTSQLLWVPLLENSLSLHPARFFALFCNRAASEDHCASNSHQNSEAHTVARAKVHHSLNAEALGTNFSVSGVRAPSWVTAAAQVTAMARREPHHSVSQKAGYHSMCLRIHCDCRLWAQSSAPKVSALWAPSWATAPPK